MMMHLKETTALLRTTLVVLAFTCARAQAQDREDKQLAPNPGFEAPVDAKPNGVPDHWQYFTSKLRHMTIMHEKTHSGEQCVRLSAQGQNGVYQGINTKIPVEPEEEYEFTVYVKNDRDDRLGGGSRGVMDIEWLNEAGNEISRVYSDDWGRNLSRMRWTRQSLTGEAPEGAVKAIFGIHFLEDSAGEGSFLIDDASIKMD